MFTKIVALLLLLLSVAACGDLPKPDPTASGQQPTQAAPAPRQEAAPAQPTGPRTTTRWNLGTWKSTTEISIGGFGGGGYGGYSGGDCMYTPVRDRKGRVEQRNTCGNFHFDKWKQYDYKR